MKKALLLLLLLPCIALSQNAPVTSSELLVRWEGTRLDWSNPSTVPMYYNGSAGSRTTPSTFSAGNVTGSNVGFNNADQYTGFYTNNWPTNASSATSFDYSKYIEFTVTAATGKKVNLKNFTFKTAGNANAYQIIYRITNGNPADNSYGSGTVLATNTSASSTNGSTLSYAFPTATNINAGETLHLRIYAYQVNQYDNKWFLKHDPIENNVAAANSDGPAIYGVVSNAVTNGVTANTDTVSTISNYNTTVNVTSNDTATNTTISSVAVQTAPSHGTAVLSGSNIIYKATTGYSGADSFTYKITGADGTTSIGTVNVTVTAQVNPNAANDAATTVKNTATTIAVTSNDTAGNGTITTVAIATNPTHGTVALSGTSIVYTPATGYVGADTFTYSITNTYGYSAIGTVSVTVNQPNPANGPLNGTYVISRSAQTEYPQFASITSAINTLNTYGVTGAVTFLFKDTTYTNSNETFPFVINSVTGGSASNTVTFKPYTGVTTTITATNINDYTGVPALFVLKGADYVTFDGSNTVGGTSRNLRLVNGDNIDYIQRSVIWIASNGTDGATNNTIKNCYMRMTIKNAASNFCVGIYSGNYAMADNNAMAIQAANADNTNLLITANDLDNVKQGVYINGGATVTTNTLVKNNDLGATIDESIICPATFISAAGFNYTENYIYNLYRNTTAGALISAGVYVGGNSYNGTITRNQMKNFTKTVTESYTFGGVVLASTNNASNILVANNFIANVSAPNNGSTYLNGHGISISGGGGYKIYHNSVVLGTSQTGTGVGFSAAFYVFGATNVDARNNIFVNNQTNTATRRCAVLVDGNISMVSNLDYNDLYSTDKTGYTGDNANWSDNPAYQVTLSGWRAASGKDAHSIAYNPVFTNATDLHLNVNNSGNDVLKAGSFISAINKDIDGQLRNTTTPAIGADEFGTVAFPTGGGSAGIYCDASTTWNGTAWSNGTPNANKDAIFTGNKTISGETFYACSLYVLNGATVEFNNNSTAIITHSVNVQTTGNLTYRSGSNLIQVEADQNSGTVTIERESGELKRLDYTLWTAPVVDNRTSGFQTLKQFSPLTSTGRFYNYNTTAGSAGLYSVVDENATKFALGKGYLIRMPNGSTEAGYNAGTTRIAYTGSFQGTPNNGTVRVALDYTDANHAYNAIGNPYASPISISDFINANSEAITGTLWIWRKTNDQTQTSYSTCNLSGYIANAAPGGGTTTDNSRIGNPFEIDAKGSLNTAQGFIVKAKASAKEVIFRNDMRLQNHSANFFRSAAATQGAQATDGIDRLWLNIAGTNNEFSQTLIAYNPATSTGMDEGYDSENIGVAGLALYTTIAVEGVTNQLGIQTRGSFNVQDVYALGFNAPAAGTYTINIDNTNGVFAAGQKVYLKDSVEGVVREITQNTYTFTTEAGDFANRFTVMYNPNNASLDTKAPVADVKEEVVVYNNNNEIKVSATAQIKSVVVYDTLGRMLYSNAKVNSNEFASGTINSAKQVVIVNIALENGQTVSKKIMMN
jgi:trimeric autotransporter adhesin